jgi:NAD(P)H-hydrate epimerase
MTDPKGPIQTLSRAAVREVDRRAIEQYGIAGLVLMENAGRGTTDVLCELGIDGPVVICCGKGNNAGDGFVIARHLDLRGYEPRILLWANPSDLQGGAATNYAVAVKSGLAIEVFDQQHDAQKLEKALSGATWIVDALLGTGALGEPRPPLDAVIEQLNAHPAPILAVDLPSGLDCDTGVAAAHTIRAQHTCTFVAAKPGLIADGAGQYVGALHVLDIGAPRVLVEELLRCEKDSGAEQH